MGYDGVVCAPGGLAFPPPEGRPYPDRHPADLILPAQAGPRAENSGREAAWEKIRSVRIQLELVRCFAYALREHSRELAVRSCALQARSASLQYRIQALRALRALTAQRAQTAGICGQGCRMTSASSAQATQPLAPAATQPLTLEANLALTTEPTQALTPVAPPLLQVTAVSAPETAVPPVTDALVIPFPQVSPGAHVSPSAHVSPGPCLSPGPRLSPGPYLSADPDTAEVPLIGGDMTEGVVRVGRTVRRPLRPHTPAVHALLRHLEAVGFEGAPRALGIDAKNREVLTYLPGVVARRPLQGFVTADSTLAALAELQLRYHHAVVGFEPPSWALWDGEVTRFVDGPPEIICHCDVNLENVIFRPGPDGLQPYAFIDFDLARPGTRLVDIIQTLRYWAPIADPADRVPALRDADAAGRIAMFCEAYGLSHTERARLVPVASRWLRRSRATIAQRARVSGGAWTRMLDAGVHDRLLRSAIWLERNRPEIEARLCRPGRRRP